MPKCFVPDASVILKWVLPVEDEPYAATAQALRDLYVRDDCDMIVPSLWLFEVGNILARKFPDHAEALLGSIVDLDIPVFVGNQAWRREIIRLAATYGVTFYDASYHATALDNNAVLVSADTRYLNKAQAAGATCFVGDWASL